MAAQAASAGVIHDESVSGDLSDDNLAPTLLMVSAGSNTVAGRTTSDPFDRDIFSFTVGAGFELAAVILDSYVSDDNQGFFAVAEGAQIASLFNPAVLLGNSLIGDAVGAMVGDDVLDNLGNAVFGGTGFMGALGAGTYSFWIQETTGAVDYVLDFQLRATVPAPSSLLLLLPALALVRRRR